MDQLGHVVPSALPLDDVVLDFPVIKPADNVEPSGDLSIPQKYQEDPLRWIVLDASELDELRCSCRQLVDKIYHAHELKPAQLVCPDLDRFIREYSDALLEYIGVMSLEKLIKVEAILVEYGVALELNGCKIKKIFERQMQKFKTNPDLSCSPKLLNKLDCLVQGVYLNDELINYVTLNFHDFEKMIKINAAFQHLKNLYSNPSFKKIFYGHTLWFILFGN